MSHLRFAFPALAFALVTALPAASASTTIAQIVASPASYYGRHVDVKGTVTHLRRDITQHGSPYVTFNLCSSRCIHVFAFGDPGTSDGDSITVHGTYETVNYLRGYTLHDGIKADGGSGDAETPCS